MFQWNKVKQLCSTEPERLPYLYLAAAGIFEFLFITMLCVPGYLGYYLAEYYLIVPCLLFLGHILREKLTPFAGGRLLLAAVAVGWFIASQIQHRMVGMDNLPITTVFFVYLMGFPFAALTDDRESVGMKWIACIFVAAAVVLVGYAELLLLDRVPEVLKEFLYWDGARLTALWHPNITALYLMMGIGFSMVLWVVSRKKWVKLLLSALVAVQMSVMALTNCRTAMLMTGAMIGGTLFLEAVRQLRRRMIPWKYKIAMVVCICVLMIPLILAGVFKLSGMLYQANNDQLAGVEQDGRQLQVDEDGVIVGNNAQGTLLEDMGTLNGRLEIWQAAKQAADENEDLKKWGTAYIGTILSFYNSFPVEHAHNSWVQVMMQTGRNGLVIAVVFTVLSVWRALQLIFSGTAEIWKKIIAIMTMCLLTASAMEPYLFFANVYYHVPDFVFIFCTGYMDYWCHCLSKQKKEKSK